MVAIWLSVVTSVGSHLAGCWAWSRKSQPLKTDWIEDITVYGSMDR